MSSFWEHDLAGRDRDVPADLERFLVGLANAQLAFAGFKVLEKIVEAPDQILATGFERCSQDLRICHDEVRRRHGVDELPRIEIDLLRCLLVHPLNLVDGRLHPARGQQV